MPRRRFQNGRVYKRGGKWVGSYREDEINPTTGKRTRRTITFDESVTSERAAYAALKPYLDDYNAKAKNNTKPSPPKGGKTVSALVREWTDKILPLRKPAGARASLSHIRAYILPHLGPIPLNEMTLSQHQAFVTAIGQRLDRRKTVENVYGTLSSILNKGWKWGYTIPDVRHQDLEFPADKKPAARIFFFDANTAARIINAAVQPFKLMCLIAAVCGLRIGEVTAPESQQPRLQAETHPHHRSTRLCDPEGKHAEKRQQRSPDLHVRAACKTSARLARQGLHTECRGLSVHQFQRTALLVTKGSQVRRASGNGKAWD